MKRKVLKMEKKNPTSCGVEASTLISYVSFVMSLFFLKDGGNQKLKIGEK